jgi:hypothetical protein
MFRLIHNQTIQNGILVDDIDDGLPNKEVHRLGSTANPKAYERDGYANKVKQSCYIPYSQARVGFPTIPGYIDVNQSNRVTLSAGKGKIFKLSKPVAAGGPGYITVVSVTAAQLVAPVVASGTTTAGAGPATAGGTTFVSVSPDISTVTFGRGSAGTTPSPATFTAAQVIAASGGVFTATSISVPASLFTTLPVVGNTVTVQANEQNSNTFSYTT